MRAPTTDTHTIEHTILSISCIYDGVEGGAELRGVVTGALGAARRRSAGTCLGEVNQFRGWVEFRPLEFRAP